MQNDNISALTELWNEEQKGQSPLPLMRNVPPETVVPMDALDGLARETVLAIQDKIGAPLATSLQSVLGVATLFTASTGNPDGKTRKTRKLIASFGSFGFFQRLHGLAYQGPSSYAHLGLALWPDWGFHPRQRRL